MKRDFMIYLCNIDQITNIESLLIYSEVVLIISRVSPRLQGSVYGFPLSTY